MPQRTHSPRAFTLIEMLTVVFIIALLIALLFPAVSKAIANAQRAKAQTMVTGLAVAFQAYYNEYGRWPVIDTSDVTKTVNTNLVSGVGTGMAGNPRNIVFFDLRAKDVQAGTGNILNPWGTNYWVAFDADYNNSTSCTIDGVSTNIPSGVAVWTRDGTTTNKYITSW